jgi:hypothetical protein
MTSQDTQARSSIGSEAIRGDEGATIIRPTNPACEAQSVDRVKPPRTDHGTLPNLKRPFADSHDRLEEGGWAWRMARDRQAEGNTNLSHIFHSETVNVDRNAGQPVPNRTILRQFATSSRRESETRAIFGFLCRVGQLPGSPFLDNVLFVEQPGATLFVDTGRLSGLIFFLRENPALGRAPLDSVGAGHYRECQEVHISDSTAWHWQVQSLSNFCYHDRWVRCACPNL